jgi:hypothetical protein
MADFPQKRRRAERIFVFSFSLSERITPRGNFCHRDGKGTFNRDGRCESLLELAAVETSLDRKIDGKFTLSVE